MNEVVKPISVAHAEFISRLSTLIKTSALPLFVVESVLKDAYNETRILSQRQLESDLETYKTALNRINSENDVHEEAEE